MKGDVKRNTYPAEGNPDATKWSEAASPNFGLSNRCRRFEELQSMSDIVRKLISKDDDVIADHRSI